MSAETRTHDVAVATEAAETPATSKQPTPPHPDAKPNVETETAPKQVQPDGR